LGFLDFLRHLFSPRKDTLREILHAIDDEIEHVKKFSSGKRVRLYDGQKRSEAAGTFYYAFKLDEELTGLSDDSPIELTVGQDAHRGSIVSIGPNEVLVCVDRDLGDGIESAILSSQMVFILEALRKRLGSNRGFNRKLAEETLKGSVSQMKGRTSVLPPSEFNRFQKDAVEQASRQSISYIWGPPGTGKTWTIGLLAYSLVHSGSKVLILSNTNVAVDRALQMICKVLPEEKVVRLGNPSLDLPSNVLNPDRDESSGPIEDFRIVGATLARSFLDKRMENLNFHTVIVDEASMATIPSIYHSAMLATRNVVIVGDFQQLPPIAMNEESQPVQKWLMRDIFEHIGISNNPHAFLTQNRLVMLRRQYRMHPQISSLVNRLVYDDLLEDADEVRSPKYSAKIEPVPQSALVLVDTAELNPWCKKSPTSSSKYNVYHTFIALTIAERILQQRKAPAIITPYAEQARRTRLLIRDRGLDKDVSVSTVHRFQGQEVDTVIYDIPDSEGTSPIWLESVISKRLLNVAVSRAQRKLIVIANRRFLFEKLTSNNIVRKAIEYIEKHGQVIPADPLLPSQFRIRDAGARTLQPDEYEALRNSQVAAFTEKTFYPAFICDLQNAKKEVSIFSPFVTSRRFGFLVEDLKGLVARNVKLSVYTRPPDRMFDTIEESRDRNLVQGASETISYLKKIGASVSIRANMHEKLAVIDLKTWWIGSLNIFSHAYTHEGMIRIQGLEKTIQNLVDEILRAPHRERKPRTKISQLSDGMKGLVVEGSIVASSPGRKVRGGRKVAEAFMSDGTGTIKLVLWEEQIQQVRQGMMVRIENCYVSSFRGTLQLNIGKYGRVISKARAARSR